MKKKVIAYTHFHWDREWYKEHEKFRFRLLKCFNIVLELLQQNKIPSFYFDGQTSALLDYLEIFPNKKELVKSLIKDKRLFIGPFYCLIDEFLASRSTFSKNLEIGLNTASDFGCNDFIAYFADTFGHSASTIPTLNKFGIDKAIVWRGCGDIPAEFTWEYNNYEEKSSYIKTVNLIRGYFQDIFSTNLDTTKKADSLKSNLDKIAEKSGNTLLLPIGADHLSIPTNLDSQIKLVNERLESYEIVLGSPFDYFNEVNDRFALHTLSGELRDNSKTFILEGCYSSRSDIKKWNILATQKLETAEALYNHYKQKPALLTPHTQEQEEENSNKILPTQNNYPFIGEHTVELINYAYKLLLQNQAHDSICGCSTDDVHEENITRYKKIIQIADSIIEDFKIEYKKNYNLNDIKIIKLDDNCNEITFDSEKKLPYQIINTKKGFPSDIFYDINKIPVTEDYTNIYTYKVLLNKNNSPSPLTPLPQGQGEENTVTLNSFQSLPQNQILKQVQNDNESDVFVSNFALGNSKTILQIKNNSLFIGEHEINLVDFVDLGDSYNYGLKHDDKGTFATLVSSKVAFEHKTSCGLELEYNLKTNSNNSHYETINIIATLNSQNDKIKFDIVWNNTHKNHCLQLAINTNHPITKTSSEDLNNIIVREFNPNYNPREYLPKTKGLEVKLNNAPMQRGVSANNVSVITQGITQYEIFNSELRLPLLRATGVISNPQNPSRTTPAGPPIETPNLQQLGINSQTIWITLNDNLKHNINRVYSKYIVIS